MDFTHDGDTMGSGGGNALLGLLAGSALNKDKDDGRSMTWFAMVIVLIVFFIAIIFLALAFKDRGYTHKDHANTDIAALLTPLIAAKSMDCKNGEIDKFEILQKLEHNEDRARQTQTQQEIGALGKEFAAMGFGLASKIDNVEKENLKNFATVQNQLGIQGQAIQQILTVHNNAAITNATIQGVIQQLTMGRSCIA